MPAQGRAAWAWMVRGRYRRVPDARLAIRYPQRRLPRCPGKGCKSFAGAHQRRNGGDSFMKSSYELAMERLNKNSPAVKLNPEQKQKLAELDSLYASKIAERE